MTAVDPSDAVGAEEDVGRLAAREDAVDNRSAGRGKLNSNEEEKRPGGGLAKAVRVLDVERRGGREGERTGGSSTVSLPFFLALLHPDSFRPCLAGLAVCHWPTGLVGSRPRPAICDPPFSWRQMARPRQSSVADLGAVNVRKFNMTCISSWYGRAVISAKVSRICAVAVNVRCL
jgi:hypothetical protein